MTFMILMIYQNIVFNIVITISIIIIIIESYLHDYYITLYYIVLLSSLRLLCSIIMVLRMPPTHMVFW